MHSFLYSLDPGYVLTTLPDVWAGLRLTLAVSAVGIAGSLLVGTGGGAVRAARVPVVSQALGRFLDEEAAREEREQAAREFFATFRRKDVAMTPEEEKALLAKWRD